MPVLLMPPSFTFAEPARASATATAAEDQPPTAVDAWALLHSPRPNTAHLAAGDPAAAAAGVGALRAGTEELAAAIISQISPQAPGARRASPA